MSGPSDGAPRRGARLAYEPALDGIRALAVLAVLVYHGGFTWARGGFLGVSVFFTLSGFLITTLLLREAEATGTISLREFWGRRFRRLLPASWLTVAAVVALALVGGWDDDQLVALRGDVPAALAQILNWRFVVEGRTYGDAFTAPSPLDHYWSLAIEEQFYVLFPLLVTGCAVLAQRRRGARSGPTPTEALRRLVGTASATVLVVSALLTLLLKGSSMRVYFGTDTRAAELAAGALLAVALAGGARFDRADRVRIAEGAGVAALLVWLWSWKVVPISDGWLFPWGLLLTATATCAVIVASMQRGAFARALGAPPLRALGRISYGVYLIHWPVARLLTPQRTGWGTVPLFVLHTALSIGLAIASYHYVEMPVRRGRRIGFGRAGVAGAVVAAVLVVVNVVVTDVEVAPRPTDRRVVAAPAPTRILVIGDQLAASLEPSVTALPGSEFEVRMAPAPDCGLVEGGWVQLPDGRIELNSDRCGAVSDLWEATAEAFRPDVVVAWAGARDLANRRLAVDGAWLAPGAAQLDQFIAAGLRELAARMGEHGATVAFVTAPVAVAPWAPAPLPPPEPPATPQEDEQRRNEQLAMSAVSADAPAPVQGSQDPARVARFNELLTDAARSSPRATLVTVGAGAPERVTARIERRFAGARRATAALPEVEAPSEELPAPPPPADRRVAGNPVRVTVVGDSVGITLANGVAAWGAANGVVVDDRTELGCPIGRGGLFRAGQDTQAFPARCRWSEPSGFPAALSEGQPDVVVVVGGAWDALDRLPDGASDWQHLGERPADRFALAEMLRAIDLLGSDGARVVLVTSAHVRHGAAQGFSNLRESDPARIDRFNQLLREAAKRRRGVATVVDFGEWVASQPGGEFSEAFRSDGVHYDASFGPAIGEWLGPRLVDVAHRG